MRNPGHDSRDLNECIRRATDNCLEVIEFGCMFGDRLAAAGRPISYGVDAHGAYLDEAEKRNPGPRYHCGDARDYAHKAATCGVPIDAVLLIDFIEHLTRRDADHLVGDCKRFTKRIVLFVPLGPHPQTRDVFNMGADHWQTHRSTWEPADLEAVGFDVAVWDGYHAQPGKDSRAAFAIWEPG